MVIIYSRMLVLSEVDVDSTICLILLFYFLSTYCFQLLDFEVNIAVSG